MTVAKELMRTNVYSIYSDEKISDLLELLINKKISGVPVIDENNLLVGIITDADVLSQIHQPPSLIDFMTYIVVIDKELAVDEEINAMLNKKICELMTKKVVTVNPETDLSEVAKILSKRKFKKVPVVDNENHLVGVISRSDVISYLGKEFLSINK